MIFYLKTAIIKSPVVIFSYAMLSNRPGTCIAAVKTQRYQACDCTVSVFLDLSDSMKDMVKIWTGPVRSTLEPSVCLVTSHR